MDRKFAIFDMDGTLVDSMGYWQSLGREYLNGRGIAEGVEEALEETKTMHLSQAVRYFLDRFPLSGDPETVIGELGAIMERHYRQDVLPKPGAAEYLTELRSRGVRMCLASATDERLVRLCLERLGLADFFSFFLSCETYGGKDRPAIFGEAARRFGVMPGNVAVFEDARTAIFSAKNAGFYTVGVYDSYSASTWPDICRSADELILDYREVTVPVGRNI